MMVIYHVHDVLVFVFLFDVVVVDDDHDHDMFVLVQQSYHCDLLCRFHCNCWPVLMSMIMLVMMMMMVFRLHRV